MKFLFVLMTVGACCALSPPSPPPTPVLEDIIKSIENKYELSQITDLLRQVSRSGELERELFDYNECQPFCSFTFFAPNNDAYNSVYIQDASDPFFNKRFRKQFILSHFYTENRQSLSDLQEVNRLRMANSKVVTVSNNKVGTIQLNDYIPLKDAIDALHGVVYVIDGVLVDNSEIEKAVFS